MRKKILVKAPMLSRSGYGEQSRFALRCLRSREDLFDIYVMNIPWGNTGHIASDDDERKAILISRSKLQCPMNLRNWRLLI